MTRAGRRSLTLTFFALVPAACAVYTDDALKPVGDFGTAGAAVDVGGTNATAGGSANAGSAAGNTGKPSGGAPGVGGTGGTGNESLAGHGGHIETSAGGDSSADGGEPSGGSSVGGKPSGGASGSAGGGAGGKAGAGNGGVGGSAGTSGSSGTSGAGGGGNGGGPSGPLCSDHPLTTRTGWVASASISDTAKGDVPANLLDNKLTRWTTGKAQSGDEWLQIDFGATVTLNHVNLQQGTDTNDYPRTYAVIVSDTAKNSGGTVRATGSGKSGVSTAILLPALASGRYLLIKQSGSSLSWWSAEEIEVSCAD